VWRRGTLGKSLQMRSLKHLILSVRYPRLHAAIRSSVRRRMSEKVSVISSGEVEQPDSGSNRDADEIEARAAASHPPDENRFITACVSVLRSARCSWRQAPAEIDRIINALPVRTWMVCDRSAPYVIYSDRDWNWTAVTIFWKEYSGPDLDQFQP
jgi:hypothetical protein